ncbi:uncharacterized protein [Malus domestica]|uniref:uncharacterized protein n=1 Tax=Malus domestica TaxID=3750 RepID=UPI0039768746
MSNLNKLNFTTLEVSGMNYLKWVQDVKLHFTTKNLRPTIEDEMDNPDPQALWVTLADRFDHQNDIILPKAGYDWQHLRFQDFKSVNENNSKVCRIQSLLKIFNETLTEEDLLEKTYSTFFATNIVLQQQYRAQKFTKFSDLISVLLLAKSIISC